MGSSTYPPYGLGGGLGDFLAAGEGSPPDGAVGAFVGVDFGVDVGTVRAKMRLASGPLTAAQ